jgi:dipeptidyl aminopeptidase/acylaminoacyl peptidase
MRKAWFSSKQFWTLVGLLFVILVSIGIVTYFNLSYQGVAEYVTFSNGDTQLAGVLVRPNTKGNYPAVVLLHGSGEQTYNKWYYRIHTNAFLRQGFAVLSYDKRGSGKSDGDLSGATYSDLVNDALAAVAFLRSQPNITPGQIGLLGVSESGWLTPEIAARDGEIAFVVNRVSSPLPWTTTVLFEVQNDLIDQGISEATVAEALQLQSDIWKFYINSAMDESIATGSERDRISALINEMENDAETKGLFNPLPEYNREDYAFRAARYAYNPQPFLEEIDVPMLYVLAGQDINIPYDQSVTYLEQLKSEHQKNITVQSYPEAGHYLYRWNAVPIEGLYVPDYLDLIVSWSATQVSER